MVTDDYAAFFLILGVFLGLFFFLFLLCWVGYLWTRRTIDRVLCPYTNLPLHRAFDLSYDSLVKAHRFLEQYPGYDNPPIRFSRALACRDTGRIFSLTINWYGKRELNWTFLSKRFPGHYVSWGSLTEDQQRTIREAHTSLEGFQTELSSTNTLAQDFEPEYGYIKPGPLYVDIITQILLGWKSVPDTNLEVLIVQKPRPSALEFDMRKYEAQIKEKEPQ